MNNKKIINTNSLKEQKSVFINKSDKWWSEGKVKTRIPEKNKLFLVKFGIIFILMIIIVLIALIGNSTKKDDQVEMPYKIEIEQNKEERELTTLQKQIKDLQTQLNNSDPTIKNLSFPNVDLHLTIDEISQ